MLIYTFAGLVAVTLVCVALMANWLKRSLMKLGLRSAQAYTVVISMLLPILAWLALLEFLATSGFLSEWPARPPRLPFIPLTALIVVVLIHRAKIFKKLLDVTPRSWPVAVQTFRIGVELAFWGLYSAGGAPVQVTFEGRNFDVLVGLTAPIVAYAIAKRNLSARLVVIWNCLGLAILGNTIFTTLTSLPGPLHLNWDAPFTAFADWPFVWIPGYLAPLAIFLHVFSIRQNLPKAKIGDQT